MEKARVERGPEKEDALKGMLAFAFELYQEKQCSLFLGLK